MSLPAQIAIVLAVFALVSGVAGLAGAANLGTALSFGQIAFALAVSWLLVRGSGDAPPLPDRPRR